MSEDKTTNIDHLTFPAGYFDYLPEDSQVAKDAQEYRRVQLNPRPSDEDLKKVGLPLAQKIDESQVTVPSATKLVYTNDVSTLPEGVSGRKIADGVFEILENTDDSRRGKAEEVAKELLDAQNRDEEARANALREAEAEGQENKVKMESPEVLDQGPKLPKHLLER